LKNILVPASIFSLLVAHLSALGGISSLQTKTKALIVEYYDSNSMTFLGGSR